MASQGALVREVRLRRGITQQALCDLVGLSRCTLANIEGGRFSAGPEVAARIEVALSLPEGCLRAAPMRRVHHRKGRPRELIPRRFRMMLENLRIEVGHE